MNPLLFGLFCCCALSLASGAPGHRHDHTALGKDDKYKITLHMFSGRKDPVWIIPDSKHQDPARIEKIIKLINNAGHGKLNNRLKTGGTLPSKQGYKGITVEHFNGKGKSLHQWVLPECTYPILEWNLAIISAPSTVVSLSAKKEVHEAILGCSAKNKTADKTRSTKNSKAPSNKQ